MILQSSAWSVNRRSLITELRMHRTRRSNFDDPGAFRDSILNRETIPLVSNIPNISLVAGPEWTKVREPNRLADLPPSWSSRLNLKRPNQPTRISSFSCSGDRFCVLFEPMRPPPRLTTAFAFSASADTGEPA